MSTSDLSESIEIARRAIASEPIPEGIDLDLIYSIVDKERKLRLEKEKLNKEYDLELLKADILAREAGIGTIQRDPITGRPSLVSSKSSPIDQFLSVMSSPPSSTQLGTIYQQGIPSGITPLIPQPSTTQSQSNVSQTLQSLAPMLGSLPPKMQYEAIKSIISESIKEQTASMKDKIDKAFTLSQSLVRHPVVETYQSLISSVIGADQALRDVKEGRVKGYNALDQILISTLQRFTDPRTGVKEAEFARIPEGLALRDRLIGSLEKLKKGGEGLTLKDREEILHNIKIMADAQGKTLNDVLKQSDEQASKFGLPPELVRGGLKEHQPFIVRDKSASPTLPSPSTKQTIKIIAIRKKNG